MIDVFSKKAACVALLRKSGPCVARAFKIVLEKMGTSPKKLQTDKGSEFYNKDVKPLLKKSNIDMFSTENDDIKSCIVERFNRTLKSRMWKYFTARKTNKYLDVLEDLIASYNDTYHSSIKMSPNQVCKENEHDVWNNLYGKYRKPSKPKLKVNDCVRISKTSRTFKKGYMPNWSEELFTISSVMRTIPITYRIKEENGDLISGSFYEKELQKVERKKEFEIEEILGTRVVKGQKQSFVKWKGYPSGYNTWIDNRSLIQLKQNI